MNTSRLLSSFALIVLSVAAAHASVFGDVRGTVLDPQQSAIAGAKVTLLARSSSFSKTTQSDSALDSARTRSVDSRRLAQQRVQKLSSGSWLMRFVMTFDIGCSRQRVHFFGPVTSCSSVPLSQDCRNPSLI